MEALFGQTLQVCCNFGPRWPFLGLASVEVGAEYKESLTMVKLPIIQDEIRLCWNPFQNMVKLTEIIYEWFANR